jgi:hypothetical protein
MKISVNLLLLHISLSFFSYYNLLLTLERDKGFLFIVDLSRLNDNYMNFIVGKKVFFIRILTGVPASP